MASMMAEESQDSSARLSAEQYQALDSDEWYDHLPDDVMSHPCVARARARRRRRRRKGGQETSDSRG